MQIPQEPESIMAISELPKFSERYGAVSDADAGLEFAQEKRLEQFTLTPDADQLGSIARIYWE